MLYDTWFLYKEQYNEINLRIMIMICYICDVTHYLRYFMGGFPNLNKSWTYNNNSHIITFLFVGYDI